MPIAYPNGDVIDVNCAFNHADGILAEHVNVSFIDVGLPGKVGVRSKEVLVSLYCEWRYKEDKDCSV